MDAKTKKIVSAVMEHGVSPPVAIARACGFRHVKALAEHLGYTRVEVSQRLLGMQSRLYPEMCEKIAGMLGMSREKFENMLIELGTAWEAMQKR